jgi:UDP-glucose 4-epimerase
MAGDIRDSNLLDEIFSNNRIQAVIHFAGLKAVGESTKHPLYYYDNNVSGTISLLKAMQKSGVFKIVFSSSATVYGNPSADSIPLKENHPYVRPTNPYGRTKSMTEEILRDLAEADERWSIAILRYFNPIGAHESGLIGESPNGIPNNLLPYISQVAVGRLKELSIFGDDYPTPDGTGIRDYIHVCDLAEGHLKALEAIANTTGAHTWNLGTGQGYSVLQVIRAFEAASGISIPYRVSPRRPGDIAEGWADPSKATAELNWRPSRSLSQMMEDTWRWQSQNPLGYID